MTVNIDLLQKIIVLLLSEGKLILPQQDSRKENRKEGRMNQCQNNEKFVERQDREFFELNPQERFLKSAVKQSKTAAVQEAAFRTREEVRFWMRPMSVSEIPAKNKIKY